MAQFWHSYANALQRYQGVNTLTLVVMPMNTITGHEEATLAGDQESGIAEGGDCYAAASK